MTKSQGERLTVSPLFLFIISLPLRISVLRRAAYFTYIKIVMKNEPVGFEVSFASTAAVSDRLAAVCAYIELIFRISWIGGDFPTAVTAEQSVYLHSITPAILVDCLCFRIQKEDRAIEIFLILMQKELSVRL